MAFAENHCPLLGCGTQWRKWELSEGKAGAGVQHQDDSQRRAQANTTKLSPRKGVLSLSFLDTKDAFVVDHM